MKTVLAAMVLASAAPMAAPEGLYLANRMEMAAALELQSAGRFRYAFDYGAVSEGAEGQWTIDGARILLTSDTAPNDGERTAAEFTSQPLLRDGDLLLLERYETVIRFKRARPNGQQGGEVGR